MNTQITTRAKACTNCHGFAGALLVMLVGLMILPIDARAEWKIDLSRRAKAVRDQDALVVDRAPAADQGEKSGFFDALFDTGEPIQELVVLNTEKGFLPATLRMRKGGKYLVHVVNVNEKEKNVSFVLDAFSEHHATFYGKVKSFRVEPKREGVYSYQCPETSFEGRVVVFAPPAGAIPTAAPQVRAPASEASK